MPVFGCVLHIRSEIASVKLNTRYDLPFPFPFTSLRKIKEEQNFFCRAHRSVPHCKFCQPLVRVTAAFPAVWGQKQGSTLPPAWNLTVLEQPWAQASPCRAVVTARGLATAVQEPISSMSALSLSSQKELVIKPKMYTSSVLLRMFLITACFSWHAGKLKAATLYSPKAHAKIGGDLPLSALVPAGNDRQPVLLCPASVAIAQSICTQCSTPDNASAPL